MIARLAIALVVLTAVVASCVMATRCPCGQSYDRDPFGAGSGFYVGPEHDEGVHCFCRCGDGPRQRLAPSETCEAYEGPCETEGGAIARLACE